MATEMYTTTNSPLQKPILADDVGAVIKSVVLAPAVGIVPYGSILARNANGMYAAAEAGDVVAGKDLCILRENADTGADGATEGVIANCIFQGVVIPENLLLAGGEALTEDMKLVLRDIGFNMTSYIDSEGNAPEKDISTT